MNHKILDSIEFGSGNQLVVLLHGAASHSGQWKTLIASLETQYQVIAFDQYGYRNSPPWSENRPMLMRDQIEPILKVLKTRSEPLHLVGHSHGASLVALIATELGNQVCSLALYEPNTFGAFDLNKSNNYEQYQYIKSQFGDLEQRMNHEESRAQFAQDLMDFWLGDGAWLTLSKRTQDQFISLMQPTALEVYAALNSPFDIQSLSTFGERVLLMYDPHTPPAARAISEYYRALLPQAKVKEFPHCGHLAPILHAEKINKEITQHLSHFSL